MLLLVSISISGRNLISLSLIIHKELLQFLSKQFVHLIKNFLILFQNQKMSLDFPPICDESRKWNDIIEQEFPKSQKRVRAAELSLREIPLSKEAIVLKQQAFCPRLLEEGSFSSSDESSLLSPSAHSSQIFSQHRRRQEEENQLSNQCQKEKDSISSSSSSIFYESNQYTERKPCAECFSTNVFTRVYYNPQSNRSFFLCYNCADEFVSYRGFIPVKFNVTNSL